MQAHVPHATPSVGGQDRAVDVDTPVRYMLYALLSACPYVGFTEVFAGSSSGTGTVGKFTGVGPLVTGAAVGRTAVPSRIWVVLGTGTSGMVLFSFLFISSHVRG